MDLPEMLEPDLDWVRHQLDALVESRLWATLTPAQEAFYQRLAALEVELLEDAPAMA